MGVSSRANFLCRGGFAPFIYYCIGYEPHCNASKKQNSHDLNNGEAFIVTHYYFSHL